MVATEVYRGWMKVKKNSLKTQHMDTMFKINKQIIRLTTENSKVPLELLATKTHFLMSIKEKNESWEFSLKNTIIQSED